VDERPEADALDDAVDAETAALSRRHLFTLAARPSGSKRERRGVVADSP
jgi:hypothetical protein